MKLIEIANKIDKSERNKSYVDLEDLINEFNLDFNLYYVDQDRLKSYYICNWLCTDSWVGWRMYFLDDEPVAVSSQVGRKYGEEFEWFSKEIALKVRDYLISLNQKSDDELNLRLCNIDDDIGNSFKIGFSGQILNPDKATYNGELIKILERIKETPDYGIDKNLKVRLSNGEEIIINVKDIDFKFNLKE